MKKDLQTAVEKRKRPTPSDRTNMVQLVVDEMRLKDENPTLDHCRTIAEKIVRQYPASFADMLQDGTVTKMSYYSLSKQLKSRVEYFTRDNSSLRRRNPKVFRLAAATSTPSSAVTSASQTPSASASPTSSSSASPSVGGLTDQYGCVRWQPEDLPQGETEETLEEKRMTMVELFAREGFQAVDRGQLDHLMSATYVLQRRTINCNPPLSVQEVKDKWPFLFYQRWLCSHFMLLTGIPIHTRMLENMKVLGQEVLGYFQAKPTNSEVRHITDRLQQIEVDDGSKAAAVILMLMAHFKEKKEALLLLADVSDSLIR